MKSHTFIKSLLVGIIFISICLVPFLSIGNNNFSNNDILASVNSDFKIYYKDFKYAKNIYTFSHETYDTKNYTDKEILNLIIEEELFYQEALNNNIRLEYDSKKEGIKKTQSDYKNDPTFKKTLDKLLKKLNVNKKTYFENLGISMEKFFYKTKFIQEIFDTNFKKKYPKSNENSDLYKNYCNNFLNTMYKKYNVEIYVDFDDKSKITSFLE